MCTILYGIRNRLSVSNIIGGSVSFSDMEDNEDEPELREFYEDSDDDEDW